MMKNNILFGIVILSLLAGTVFCTGSAALQVTGHSTIPDTIYSGTTGQLQLNLQNTGQDPADAVSITYTTPDQSGTSQVSIGDIGAGSSAVASIPFTVPAKVGSGYFVISMNIAYFSDATNTVVKSTPVSIPIEIAQHQILAIQTLSVQPQVIQPGDTVTTVLEIGNTGGVMNNVVIQTPEGSDFTISGDTRQTVGNIPSNGSVNATVSLVSSSSTASGKYSIPIIVSYEDALQNTVNQTVDVGPVTVSETSGQLRISIAPETTTEIGSEAKFLLTIENMAGSPVAPIVDLNDTSVFTPIGPSRIFFDTIAPFQNESQEISLGVVTTGAAGFYDLPMMVTFNGVTYEQDVGIAVNATPDVIVTATTQPAYATPGAQGVQVLAQISNVGNSQIRSVYAIVAPDGNFPVLGTRDKFIGTMNVDDFATFQFTVNVPQSVQPGEYSIPVNVTFKNGNNVQETIVRDAVITIYSAQQAGRANVTSSGAGPSGGFSGRGGGGGILGFSFVQIGIIIVVLVAAYFIYKWWKGRGKGGAKK